MAISPYLRDLRASIGHDVVLLPSVAVLPIDDAGRVLLVRQTDRGTWGTVGGAVDVDEAPADAARREAAEEIRTDVELTGLLAVVGGPDYRITYPNGDQCSYVSTVYTARIAGPEPTPDREEVSEVRWFTLEELADPAIGDFARTMFRDLGWAADADGGS